MLQYLESGAGAASNLPPSSFSQPRPRPERVRHLLYGSLPALDRTIKILHALGYADPNDWSDPLPVPQGGITPPTANAAEETPPSAAEETPPSAAEGAPPSAVEGAPPSGAEVWMVIMTKTLLLE